MYMGVPSMCQVTLAALAALTGVAVMAFWAIHLATFVISILRAAITEA